MAYSMGMDRETHNQEAEKNMTQKQEAEKFITEAGIVNVQDRSSNGNLVREYAEPAATAIKFQADAAVDVRMLSIDGKPYVSQQTSWGICRSVFAA